MYYYEDLLNSVYTELSTPLIGSDNPSLPYFEYNVKSLVAEETINTYGSEFVVTDMFYYFHTYLVIHMIADEQSVVFSILTQVDGRYLEYKYLFSLDKLAMPVTLKLRNGKCAQKADHHA